MATTAQRLIVNVESGNLLPTIEGLTGSTQPRYVLGDTTPVEIYLVKTSGGGTTPLAPVSFPAGATVRLAVGVVNQHPTSGDWHLGFGANETGELDASVSAADLEDALNALASITSAGGVTVSKVGNQYQITFNTYGNKGAFTGRSSSLFPASEIQIQTLQEGDATTHEVVLVNLFVRPIALTTTFTDLPVPSGSYGANNFELAGSIRSGSFRLQLSYGQDGTTYTLWTQPILPNQNPTQISQIIFQSLVNSGWGQVTGNATKNAWGATVTLLENYSWRVDFVAPEFTTTIPVVAPTIVGIDVADLIPLEGKQGELNLATAEAIAYLGSESSKRATLELEVTAGSINQTLCQVQCDIVGEVIVDGAFAPVPLDVPLAESVANNRFVRRDADQTLDSTSKNQIWENLTGVTTPTGVDLVAALTGAATPSASNVFATMGDIVTYDQSLNTTDSVQFSQVTATTGFLGPITASGASSTVSVDSAGLTMVGTDPMAITFPDTTTITTGLPVMSPSDTNVAVVWDIANQKWGTSAGGMAVAYDQAGSYTIVSEPYGSSAGDPALKVSRDAGVNHMELNSYGLKFPDATTQESAPVYSAGTGQSGGTGATIHGDDYPDEVHIVIGGVTYAMPARIV